MHVRKHYLRPASKLLAAGSGKLSQERMIPRQTFARIAAHRMAGHVDRIVTGMLLAVVFFAYPATVYPNGQVQPTATYYQISDPAAPAAASSSQKCDSTSNVAFVSGCIAPGLITANQPPQQPELKQPATGDASVDLKPEFLGTPFSDGDQNDTHLRTQWRIEASGDGHVVMDMSYQGHNLTDLRVPGFVLDPLSSYHLQIRYFDQSDEPSPWSKPVFFSTVADPHDLNGNRIPDSQEIGSFIDFNADGIDDADQSSRIKSILNFDGSLKLAVGIAKGDEAVEIQAATNVDPSSLPEPFYATEEMGYGLLQYKISVPNPGQELHVIIYVSDPIGPGTPWLRYDSVMGWEDISDEIHIAPDGTRITRFVIDGGTGDADGTANGIIVDQCGPLTVENAAISDGESDAADGVDATTCFIQTIRRCVK